MITCTLGGKKYSVDFVSGRAMREMEPAVTMYGKIVAASNAALRGEEVPEDMRVGVAEAMDTMVHWFCLLFGNQFTPDDVYDKYPVDRIMNDMVLALAAVQAQATEQLSAFPTVAAPEKANP